VIGVLCLEATMFQVILPVICAGALAAWDASWPSRAPAAWLVGWFGRPPTRWIAAPVFRINQAMLVLLCLGSVLADAAGAPTLGWVVAALAGVLAIATAVTGRPMTGMIATKSRGGPS
jgi:hypothetical protein